MGHNKSYIKKINKNEICIEFKKVQISEVCLMALGPDVCRIDLENLAIGEYDVTFDIQ